MQCELDKATIDCEEHGADRPILMRHGGTMDRCGHDPLGALIDGCFRPRARRCASRAHRDADEGRALQQFQ